MRKSNKEIVIHMWESGKTLQQIEDATNLTQEDIHYILKEHNLL